MSYNHNYRSLFREEAGAMSDIPHLVAAGATFHTPRPDPLNPRAGDWLRTWDGVEPLGALDAVVVGAPLSRTSLSHSGAFLLPTAIRRVLLDFSTYSSDYGIDLAPLQVRDVGDIAMELLDAYVNHAHIESVLRDLFSIAPLVVTLGGDHSITRPALIARSKVEGAKLGVVQFDAHHDVRVLDHGPNNGTPIRGGIEAGAIAGEWVAQIGIHGFSNSAVYAQYAREQGIAIHTMGDVRRRGILAVTEDAWATASQAPGGVYVTVDMDVLDRAIAPGCPASSPGGMAMWEMQESLFWLAQRPGIVGIDFVEVDPTRDSADMTVKATCLAMLTFLAGRAARSVNSSQ